MLRHARPHLEIHTRSKGHSAVAGAAYRLGLRLYDERMQVWHDYRKRALGEEVVMALTVAPDGAPEWASDPAQLWNAVEASEKRKDSQIARDYRVPIPLGLDDQRAGRLAEKLARFIMSELGTPVSVGLHRDASVDALGQVKPAERQGFHAHLYFPSRPLVIEHPGGDHGDAEEAGASFGPRHPMLASKALGRGMVELFNKTWSELANDEAADAGMDARYEYQSYERLGVDLTPQPTLGAGATALERKGFFTRKGDAVRDILVASKAYELAHSEAVAAQQEVAQADVARERSAWNEAEPAPAPALALAPEPRNGEDGLGGPDTLAITADPDDVLARLPPGATLVDRFQALAPRPGSRDESSRMGRLLRLVRSLQRALALLRGLADRLVESEASVRRARSGKADADYELDEARRHRAAAIARADDWAHAHPIRMRAAKLARRKPKQWADLEHDIIFHRKAVDQIKTIVEAQRSTVTALRADSKDLEQRTTRARRRIRAASDAFMELGADLFPPLLAAMTPLERQEVAPETTASERQRIQSGPIIDEQLSYRPPTLRPRP